MLGPLNTTYGALQVELVRAQIFSCLAVVSQFTFPNQHLQAHPVEQLQGCST